MKLMTRRTAAKVSVLAAGWWLWRAAPGPAAAEPPSSRAAATQPAHPFRPYVKVEWTDDFMVVHSTGIPDHETGNFPNQANPNSIRKQDYTFHIPRRPTPAKKPGKLPMGPIGVAINGVPFYNPYTREGEDAAMNEVFDECCGHPDPRGRYHYHIYPKCVKTPFKKDEGNEHSPLLGYAFDGYGIYGPFGEGGKRPADLDACNGHTDATLGYHYHVTDRFPYVLGGYHGTAEASNLDRRGPRPGGPPRGLKR